MQLGGAVSDLAIAISHEKGFTQGQTGALYKLTVGNVGDLANFGPVSVFATLPSGMTATAISGSGWTCVLGTLTCTRSDSRIPGTAYPAIVVTLDVAGNLTGDITASATVSGGGDANNANNFISDTTFVRMTTTTSMTSSPNPSTLGQSVTLTAIISSGTGKVTFYDGTAVLGIATVVGNQATFSTSLLSSGSHSLRARYNADSTYGPSLSLNHLQTVNVLPSNGMKADGSYLSGNYAASADFDHDGKLDLVTGGGKIFMGNGDGTFHAGANSIQGSLPVTGDFNGDGNADVVLDTTFGKGVFLGNGDGTFQPEITSSTRSSFVLETVATDVDQDGILDLVVNSNGPLFLFVMLGNGDGSFQMPLDIPSAYANPGFWAIADFNRDGRPDVALTGAPTFSSLTLFLGRGDGTFQPPVTYPGINTEAKGLAAGDFNSDGNIDVLFTYLTGAGVLLGSGDGSFQSTIYSSFVFTATPPWHITVPGDFNGDGNLDFAYGGYSTNVVQFVFGNGDGTFQSLSPNVTTDGTVQNVVLSDFNGDGRPDIAVASLNIFLGGSFSGLSIDLSHTGRLTAGQSKIYQIVVSNPLFAAANGIVTVTGTLPSGLTATNLAGNGWTCTLATITCTRSDTLNGSYSYPSLSLTVQAAANLSPSTLNVGASVSWNSILNSVSDPTIIVFATTTSLSTSPNPSILGQTVTLTAMVTAGIGSVSFYDGGAFLGSAMLSGGHAILPLGMIPAGVRQIYATYAGDSTHAPSNSSIVTLTVNAAQASGLVAAGSLTTGASPLGITMGDFNGDGKIDLVTPNANASTISVFLGNGNGTFQTKVDYPVGNRPAQIAIGDLNNDSKPDLAVANRYSSSLSVLLNNGDVTFSAAATLSGPYLFGVSSLVASDFDADGKVDLIATNANSGFGGPYLLAGNADGSFAPPSSLNGCCSTFSLAMGDFNGDGKPDLADYYIYMGNGDGTFQTLYDGSLASLGPTATIGDLNADGKADVVVLDNSDGVNVAAGNGDGTFQPSTRYNAGLSPVGVALADVNGDGKIDMITANSGSGNATVLFGAGDGTFPSSTSYTAGTTPHGVVAGDFNGDGRTDVAISNYGSDNITILLGVLTPTLVLQPASVTPSSGSGLAQTMTFAFNAPDGFASLSVVNVLINNAINGIAACYVAFVPSTGSLFLVDDGGNAGGPYVGMTLPGSGTIQNSQCSIAGTGSSFSGSANTLTLTLAITFNASFAGNKVIYMAAQDNVPTNSGWQTIGVWNVPGPVPPGPSVGGVSPGNGNSATQTYTFTFNNTNGFADLAVMNVLINNAINGIAACYIAFVPSGPTAGSIYLVNDAGSAGGPFAGMVLPGSGSVSNSQCTIDGTGSSVSGSGNTLTLILNMTLKPAFAGNKVIYMAARSNSLNSDWQPMGTVNVPQ